jgi:hypothetical protein
MAKMPLAIRSKARQHADGAIRVLVEIMNDRAAPMNVRVQAATEILNRGLGKLVGAEKFAPLEKEFYVYSVHDKSSGALLYIGKGCERRHLQSASRLRGKSRIRASFDKEADALAFERRLIKAFRPKFNIIYAAEISEQTA